MFWNRENVTETTEKRIKTLESEVLELKSQILAVLLDQKVLRDKVLRKIQFKHTEEEEEKPKDIYNGMFLKE